MNSLSDGTALCDLGGVPIDAIAWRVLQPGEHYVPRKKIAQLTFDVAPPIRGTKRGRGEKRPENLTGRRIGRLTVYGYWGRKDSAIITGSRGGSCQVWVCRCDCGIFVTRRASTINKARDPDDKCDYCRQHEYIQRRSYFERTGKWPDHWRRA